LVHLDDPKKQYLSFVNLVEPRVLAAIRRRHGVVLPRPETEPARARDADYDPRPRGGKFAPGAAVFLWPVGETTGRQLGRPKQMVAGADGLFRFSALRVADGAQQIDLTAPIAPRRQA
jgi:hypothetical protein